MSDQTGKDQGKPECRMGLALSGGGFRASFFHIGVLARLADLNLLRQIEVISTVSGGSIIGALYYLHVRKLLQSKPDLQIKPEDYVQLVETLQQEFQKAVKKNFRMRTFSNACKNLQMFTKSYSRSDRLAELFAKFLYAPVVEAALQPQVPLPGLKIQPDGEKENFHPFAKDARGRTANNHRQNKVPILVINTTTLNTGHNYQFTATWMGEPPNQRAQRDLDKNSRLRRAYYLSDGLPEKYQRLPLGIAVAASASVPGIFHPLALTELHQGMTPQLVDGGVHDNQGAEGLLDEEVRCTHVIVSDASGQLPDLPGPNTRGWSVVKRSSDISMDRVREEEYEGLDLRKSTSEIREFVFIHLKEDLKQQEFTWIGGTDKPGQQGPPSGKTAYQVHRRIQQLLADIRTDLDSFTEVETHALMADGYLITNYRITEDVRKKLDPVGTGKPLVQAKSWDFLKIKDYLSTPEKDPRFVKQLEVAGSQFFKVWKLSLLLKFLKWSGVGLLILFSYFMFRYMFAHASEAVPGIEWLFKRVNTLGALGATLITLGLYLISYLLPPHLRWVLSWRGLPRRWALRFALATFGWLAVWTHLLTFDKLFLCQGKVAQLRK